MDDFDYVLFSESTNIGIWVISLEKEQLDLYAGEDVDLETFVEVCLYGTDVITRKQTGDYYVATYTEPEGDYQVHVYNAFYFDGSYYYSVAFDCLDDDYNRYSERFSQWAEKVRFTG